MLEVITFTMYLITITDIETANVEVHRLVLDNHAEYPQPSTKFVTLFLLKKTVERLTKRQKY